MSQVSVREYDYLVVGAIGERHGNANRHAICIAKSTFEYLSRLLGKEESKEQSDDHSLFLKRSSWKGKPAFQVQSYVGVLQTPCGMQIEILPKISDATKEGDEKSRKVLLRMLRYLKDANFKQSGDAHLNQVPMHLLELFMTYFLQEVNTLVKRGVRSDYVTREENQAFLKGKLLINQQIRVNAVQQQRFFCAYDEYEPNRPENRLIHCALQKVSKLSRNANNQRLCRELMFVFADIPVSRNVRQDFSKCKSNRAMTHYQHPLEWCKMILNEESTVSSAGSTKTISILFPMEKIFEDYVAAMLKREFQGLGYTVSSQVSKKSLCRDHYSDKNAFRLKPDILITDSDNRSWVVDTKWKVIDESQSRKNYLISQADMYQLYAYGKKYDCEGLFLVYPKVNSFKDIITFDYEDGETLSLPLWCLPFDCEGEVKGGDNDQAKHISLHQYLQ